MPTLEELFVQNNYLIVLPPEISKLKKLRVLDLSGNALMKLPEEVIDLNLEILNISSNKFIHSPVTILEKAVKKRPSLRVDYKATDKSKLRKRQTEPFLKSDGKDKKLSEKYKAMRVNALLELLSSEQKYYKYLHVLANQYYCPLTGIETNEEIFLKYPKKPIIPFEEAKLMFPPDLMAIVNLSKQLEKDLSEKIPTGNPEETNKAMIGQVFIEAAPYFKLYTNYISLYQQAQSYISKFKNNSRFMNKIILPGRDIPNADGLELEGLLVMPIQRIPRYSMLVKAVMKYTPHNHPDYTYLEKAIEKIDAVAAYVDERIEHACNRMKIISLQQEYNIPDLIQPSRIFIKEGDIYSVLDEMSYYAYLMNDALLLKENQGNSFAYIFQSKKEIVFLEFNSGKLKVLDEQRFELELDLLNSTNVKYEFLSQDDWISALLKAKGIVQI